MKHHHTNKCRAGEGRLPELFEETGGHQLAMIDVGAKAVTHRRAVASGGLKMGAEAFKKLATGTLPKGNALALAEVSGIMAAKKTAELLPLCHPLPLDKVAVTFHLDEATHTVTAHCVVIAHAKTGVEMEALMGVQGALLGLYDLIKGVDAALTLIGSRLEVKEGGKSGLWLHPEAEDRWQQLKKEAARPPLAGIRTAVVTLSDRASRGEYEDLSGPAGEEVLRELGAEIAATAILPDEEDTLVAHIEKIAVEGTVDLLVTTGGTGLSNRDRTPEAVARACSRLIPGFGELLRGSGATHTKFSWLSRSVAGVAGRTLVVALPGNPKALREGLTALQDILPHALETVKKEEPAA